MTKTVRINKYLADHKYSTRTGADALVARGAVRINGKIAVLGQKVSESDKVEVNVPRRSYRYFAYNKPRGVITHSAQYGEKEIAQTVDIKGVFPVGRLDKDSYGLILLTDDGRLTNALLNPDHEHDKEYQVLVRDPLPSHFKRRMEAGVVIQAYRTKKCTVHILGAKKFSIILTEGKKHQIRRMCDALGVAVVELKRTRILNVKLGNLAAGEHRRLAGTELQSFLKHVGL